MSVAETIRSASAAPLRPVRLGPAAALVDRKPDGTIFIRSPHPLEAYPVKLTERLERTGPATMAYEVTVDDPKAYTGPWKQARVFKLMPNTELMEYVCLENEKDREHLVGIKK